MLIVKPEVIDPNGSARISHDGDTTVTVTITNGDGGQDTISVPPDTEVEWQPPPGWTEARFNAPGYDEVYRLIQALGEASA